MKTKKELKVMKLADLEIECKTYWDYYRMVDKVLEFRRYFGDD